MPVLIQAPPESLRPNPWNTNVVSPELEAKLEASITRLGMFKPVVCRELVDGSLEILGGEHRNRAAVKLKFELVPVLNLGLIDDIKAKEIGLVDNARYGNDDTLQLAALLKDLGNVEELGSFMPYSDAEFASIFAASSIALDDLDIPDDGGLPATTPADRPGQTHSVMRFKVPIDDVETLQVLIESTMKAQKFTEEDSLANAGNALVWLLKKGSKK